KTSRSTILILDISGQYNGAETQEHKSESVKFRIRMRDAGWQRHEAVGLFPRGRPECGEGLQGFGVVGPEFECAGIFLESLVALVLPCEHAAEVVMGGGVVGVCLQRLPEPDGRAIEIAAGGDPVSALEKRVASGREGRPERAGFELG